MKVRIMYTVEVDEEERELWDRYFKEKSKRADIRQTYVDLGLLGVEEALMNERNHREWREKHENERNQTEGENK